MRKTLFALCLLTAFLNAQETVAPTGPPNDAERVGSIRGADAGGYNIVQSWEFGYRFASLGGNQDKYRSDVNYRDGLRLLNSNLTINSKDGHGKWFDEIVVSTQGLGNDPYESATLRVQKNQLYRYDLLWRRNDYFNPGLTIADGQHLQTTTHGWQDHDLTLFPQSHFRLRAGYSRVAENGPALSTEQLFDSRSDVFTLFRNIRREFNDYRLGADGEILGFRFTVQRRWEFFKEDSADTRAAPGTALTSLIRSQPYRGETPGWMGNLFGERKYLTLNARVTYAAGTGSFVQNETAIGSDRFGSAANRQVIVLANGNRPVVTGDFNITLLPQSRFTLINHTSASNTRMNGNNFYQQFDNKTFSFASLNFQFLGIRLITNATDARFRFTKKFDIFAGFRYSDREIRSIEAAGSPGFPYDTIAAQQSNQTKAGVAGFNWIPLKNLRAHFEGEIGRNNNPFTPTSLRDYHALRSKVQYRTRTMSAGVSYQENYNNNSIQITAYSSRARNYSAEASWNAKSWVSLDGSYSKLHLDTIGGIDFFSGAPRPVEITGQSSIYISNIHAANLGLRFALKKYADLYVAYNLTKDTGDGRSSLTTSAFYNSQTFPLTYQSPLLRLSVRMNEKLRWNFGYQYYGYKEDFGLFSFNQNYRANTGYTSLLWSF
jgi:hypothetical protein